MEVKDKMLKRDDAMLCIQKGCLALSTVSVGSWLCRGSSKRGDYGGLHRQG